MRNNNNKRRTPKWAIRYGLIDTTEIDRKKKKSEWANRYNERLPHSTLDDQEYEEGQIPDRVPEPSEQDAGRAPNQFWREDEERFYDANGRGTPSSESGSTGRGGGRWSYPANFDDTIQDYAAPSKKKKKSKKDRFARAEDAYSTYSEDATRKKRKSKKSRSTDALDDGTTITDPMDADNDGVIRRDTGLTRPPRETDGDRYSYTEPNPILDDLSSSGAPRDPLEHEF